MKDSNIQKEMYFHIYLKKVTLEKLVIMAKFS